MTRVRHAQLTGVAILLATVVLPLLGAWADGRDLAPVFAFPPPLAIPGVYPKFAWFAVLLILSPFAALAGSWLCTSRGPRAGRECPVPRAAPSPVPAVAACIGQTGRQRSRFPAWGWMAFAWTVGWWVLAWIRFPWMEPLQRHTFFPIWFGFILTVNAATMSRSGNCQLTRFPRRWLGLFLTSAAFWWVFEWLNRFSHNWHYLGVADFGPAGYALNATLCFSTVLPAVAAVAELLGSSHRFQQRAARGPRLRWFAHRGTGVILLLGGLTALVGTGLAPDRCYPALWAAPLALLLADEILARRGLPAAIASGDWRLVGTWAVAALICGFFWELWNVHSAAKWVYTVPYVDRWHVFEMPALGYAGYLPFGLECYYVIDRVLGSDRPFSNASST